MNLEEKNRILTLENKNLKSNLKKCKKESLEDSLTSMLNRRAHDKYIEDMKVLIKRFEFDGKKIKHYFWYIMIDLDNFKYINDNFGHQMGDKILIDVAKVLKENIRVNDKSFRIGGDEFVVVTHNKTQKQLEVFLRRILSKINKIYFGDISLQASIGVAGYNNNVKETMEHADRMMYLSKKSDNKINFFHVASNVKFYNFAFGNLKSFLINWIKKLF